MGVVGALCIIAVGLVLLLACLRYRSLCTRFINWLLSDREEKAVLTRLKGHYNANGYLVRLRRISTYFKVVRRLQYKLYLCPLCFVKFTYLFTYIYYHYHIVYYHFLHSYFDLSLFYFNDLKLDSPKFY